MPCSLRHSLWSCLYRSLSLFSSSSSSSSTTLSLPLLFSSFSLLARPLRCNWNSVDTPRQSEYLQDIHPVALFGVCVSDIIRVTQWGTRSRNNQTQPTLPPVPYLPLPDLPYSLFTTNSLTILFRGTFFSSPLSLGSRASFVCFVDDSLHPSFFTFSCTHRDCLSTLPSANPVNFSRVSWKRRAVFSPTPSPPNIPSVPVARETSRFVYVVVPTSTPQTKCPCDRQRPLHLPIVVHAKDIVESVTQQFLARA